MRLYVCARASHRLLLRMQKPAGNIVSAWLSVAALFAMLGIRLRNCMAQVRHFQKTAGVVNMPVRAKLNRCTESGVSMKCISIARISEGANMQCGQLRS